MKTRQPELRGNPQFDFGRWKLRLELVPFHPHKQSALSIIPMKSKPPFENGVSYLLASDFHQTLSFNDPSYVLCDLLGIHGFEQKVAGLAKSDLAYRMALVGWGLS